jgi:hypothetical protein
VFSPVGVLTTHDGDQHSSFTSSFQFGVNVEAVIVSGSNSLGYLLLRSHSNVLGNHGRGQ